MCATDPGSSKRTQARLAGVARRGIAVGSAWAYLSSIEIDDGLEGLIFLPILGVASILVALVARSWSGQLRPVVGAVAGDPVRRP